MHPGPTPRFKMTNKILLPRLAKSQSINSQATLWSFEPRTFETEREHLAQVALLWRRWYFVDPTRNVVVLIICQLRSVPTVGSLVKDSAMKRIDQILYKTDKTAELDIVSFAA